MRLKKLIALVSSVTMLGAVSAIAPATVSAKAGDDIIHTGHMEYAGEDEIPYYWYAKEKTENETKYTPTIARSDEQAHGGTYSLKVSNRAHNETGAGNYFAQPEAGKTYIITASIYPTEEAVFHCAALSGYWKNVGLDATGVCEADKWTTLTATVQATEWKDGSFQIWSESGTGDFYVDDVSMVEQGEEAPEVPAAAELPVDDTTFNNDSIPEYYTTTATGGLSVSNGYLIAKNRNSDGKDQNIDAGSEFITINLGSSQLNAGDVVNFSFNYSNGNYGTASAAEVYLSCGGKDVEEGETEAFTGQNGSVSKSFSKAITVPADYAGGDIKLVLRVSASTGAPRIKDVKISKTAVPATHKEGFTFTAALEELQNKTLKITAQDADGNTGTATTPYSDLSITETYGTGDAVLGIIIENIPYGTEITSAVFE